MPLNFVSGWHPAFFEGCRRESKPGAGESCRSPAREVLSLEPAAARLALVALLDEVVDQFARGVIHLHVERFDTTREVVKRHNRGDGHQQAERRGYQSFRNTAGDRADARSLLGGDLLEGIQNADDRSEQPDEWSRRADGGQTR